jgi:hypothetical protein
MAPSFCHTRTERICSADSLPVGTHMYSEAGDAKSRETQDLRMEQIFEHTEHTNEHTERMRDRCTIHHGAAISALGR